MVRSFRHFPDRTTWEMAFRGQRVDHSDNLVGLPPPQGRFSGEDMDPLNRRGSPTQQSEVLVNDMENMQELPLVLVGSLDLEVEWGFRE